MLYLVTGFGSAADQPKAGCLST